MAICSQLGKNDLDIPGVVSEFDPPRVQQVNDDGVDQVVILGTDDIMNRRDQIVQAGFDGCWH